MRIFKAFLPVILALAMVFPVTAFADEVEAQTPAPIYLITNDRVNFRDCASTDGKIIRTINKNVVVTFVSQAGEGDDIWYQVESGRDMGYIKAEFLEITDKEPTAFTVSLTPWKEAKSLIPLHTTIEVYDVLTGLTYYIKSFSNGNHADVEPITTEDTAIMKKTYGGRWEWDPRPVWVTVNGVTMAASINGMPHGGGVNNQNGMNGQVCLHFLGSTTHNGNKTFERDHQRELKRAYDNAQALGY